MTWFKTNDASISNGGTVVAIGDGANTSVVKAGDALIIGSFQPVEVKAVFSGQIELVSAWNNSTQSGVAATAMPTSGDFKSATEALRNATKITQDNYKVIQDWGKETGTVTFVDYEGTEHEAKTMKEMENIFDASLAQREAAYDALIATSHPHWSTERDMHAMLAQNNDKFAASGFVHFGQHAGAEPDTVIGEGLSAYYSGWSTPNTNRMWMGRATSSNGGSSKSDAAVVNIAGFVTEIYGIGDGFNGGSRLAEILFPDAPDGTVTYDSATGTIFDYATQTDPKYGDVAADHNEALARAFEGNIKNGDFRSGGDDWEDATGQATIDTDGVFIPDVKSENIFIHSKDSDDDIDWTVDNVVEVYVSETDATGGQGLRIRWGSDYFGDYTIGDGETGVYKVVVPANTNSSSGGFKLFRYNGHGGSMRVKSVSVRPVGNEVVINRVDMWGFEGFLEKITPTNPFVYKYGLVQSQANDIDGVATTSSNRPDTYYAVFSGDTTSRGKGVDFLSLSTLEQDAIALNPKNHIYKMANGDLVQWRVRQRTIAGAGNGAWADLTKGSGTGNYVGLSYGKYSTTAYKQMLVIPQGDADAPVSGDGKSLYPSDTGAGGSTIYFTSSQVSSSYLADATENKGVFKAKGKKSSLGYRSEFAYGGEHYFLVCGTVARPNQGAYHPAHNPAGTNFLWDTDKTPGTYAHWYQSAAHKPVSLSECFTYVNPAFDTEIAGGRSTRKDQYEYHDAIYAGQVNDMRMSAWGVKDTPAALEGAIRKAVRGEMRGKGKVPFTTIREYTSGSGGTSDQVAVEDYTQYSVGDLVHLEVVGGSYIEATVVEASGNPIRVSVSFDRLTLGNVVHQTELSAEFDSLPWVDLVGDPNDIKAAFHDGVVGKWVSGYVHGGGEDVHLNAKANDSSVTYVQTENDGATWSSGTRSVDNVTNEAGLQPSAGTVTLLYYEVLSGFTEAADNSKIVGRVGDVIVTHHALVNRGNRLMPSLIGKPSVSGQSGYEARNYSLIRHSLTPADELNVSTAAGVRPIHDEIELLAPQNGSPAAKALYTLTEKSGQLFLQFHGREMIFDDVLAVNADNTFTAWVVGETYRVTNGFRMGVYICVGSWFGNIEHGALVENAEGDLVDVGSSAVKFRRQTTASGNWGDDDTIPAGDGDGTMTDLNGNTVKTFCHHSMTPIGWVKNEI